MSLCTCVPLFAKNGFTVGQKSFDLQPPTHLSIKYLLIDFHHCLCDRESGFNLVAMLSLNDCFDSRI